MNDPVDTYIISSSPVDLRPALDLHHELLKIGQTVRDATRLVRLRHVFPPTFEQLERMLLVPAERARWKPRLLHFLGHGEEDGLWFETTHGEGDLVSPDRLQKLLAGSSIEVVLLNACWSAGKRILGICDILTRTSAIRAAIGHHEPVDDVTAIEFGAAFYRHVIDGESIGDACRKAALAISERDPNASENVYIAGDAEVTLSVRAEGSSEAAIVDDGMPSIGFLPDRRSFFGRAEEITEISWSLDDVDLAAFGIWGIGGLGKTTLALEAANRNAWRYVRGGVAFVDVRDLPQTRRTVADVFRSALQLLRGPALGGGDPVAELFAWMKANATLVILDNLEDLAAAERAALARLMDRAPRSGSRFLLTSRTPVETIDESSRCRSITLTRGLSVEDGTDYVHRIALLKGLGATFFASPHSHDEPSLCSRIAERFSGHPRMLELAVGIATRSLSDLEAALGADGGTLEERLFRLLETGLAVVGDEGRRLLPFFTLFPAGHVLLDELHAAIRGVDASEAPDRRDPWIDAALEQLRRGGFVEIRDAQAISFHESVLSTAQRLDERERSNAFFGLLAFYLFYFLKAESQDDAGRINVTPDYVKIAERALVLMETAGELDRIDALEDLLARISQALILYFIERGVWKEGWRWTRRAIDFVRTSREDDRDRRLAVLLRNSAIILMESKDAAGEKRMMSDLAESKELFERIGHRQASHAVVVDMAKIAKAQENYTLAASLLEEAASVAKTLSPRTQAVTLHELSIVLAAKGDLEKAETSSEAAIAIHEENHDDRELSKALIVLVTLRDRLGAPLVEQRTLARKALEVSERAGDQRGEGVACEHLGGLEFALGNPIEARRMIDRAMRLYAGLNEHHAIPALLASLSRQEALMGNPLEAKRLIEQAVELETRMGARNAGDRYLIERARIERQMGNLPEARALLQRAVESTKNDPVSYALALHQLGGVELSLRNPRGAKALYEQAIAIREQSSDVRELAATFHQLALAETMLENTTVARTLFERAAEIMGRVGDVEGQAKVLGMLAQTYANEGDLAKAIPIARKSVDALQRIGSKDAQAMAYALFVMMEAQRQSEGPQ